MAVSIFRTLINAVGKSKLIWIYFSVLALIPHFWLNHSIMTFFLRTRKRHNLELRSYPSLPLTKMTTILEMYFIVYCSLNSLTNWVPTPRVAQKLLLIKTQQITPTTQYCVNHFRNWPSSSNLWWVVFVCLFVFKIPLSFGKFSKGVVS